MSERCAHAAREVFRCSRLGWLTGTSGIALYERAEVYAHEYDCTLVREIPGHRVADFPHALYGKHKLIDADFVLNADSSASAACWCFADKLPSRCPPAPPPSAPTSPV